MERATGNIIFKKINEFEPTQTFKENIYGRFHTALSTEKNEALILFDKKNIYIFELKED